MAQPLTRPIPTSALYARRLLTQLVGLSGRPFSGEGFGPGEAPRLHALNLGPGPFGPRALFLTPVLGCICFFEPLSPL